ncbi:unnamed protein product [Bursaphelenchus okinawaensis]|uniref:SH3 domain-containing protein n=1 Tax=Bursaphelenchus okinawaensis TaxID=465554 RepID=A0A811K6I8_9BILA|nr:unnamed protein product [Bursaphelenchus okinawaensis]CAG9092549.1 unnamed protein product [Bursaphelenchus okinawaensis]
MTVNLLNNEADIKEAIEAACNSDSSWSIFEYDGASNILKVAERGDSGLKQILEQFDTSKIQYGLVPVSVGGQRKVILIHWQGEGVPAVRLAQIASHLEEIKRIIKKINLTIYARNEEDIDVKVICNQLQKLAMAPPPQLPAKPQPFVPSTPAVNQVKQVRPDKEIELSEREKFWNELRAEEEERRKDDLKKQEEQQKQYELERKLWEKELHKIHISAAAKAAQEAARNLPAPPPAPKPVKKNTLVSGRAQMFDDKVAELVRTTPKVLSKNKQFKFEVALQPKNPPPPVNSSANIDETFIPLVFEDPTRPVAKVVPQQPEQKEEPVLEVEKTTDNEIQKPTESDIQKVAETEIQKIVEADIQKSEEKEAPRIEVGLKVHDQSSVTRALTLWDYQADDNTEISFDPNWILTDIEQLYDGWWRGRAPNGQVGLFPSNYVKLL